MKKFYTYFQEKLWRAQELLLFPNQPTNPVAKMLLIQSLFANLTELRHLQILHQERLVTVPQHILLSSPMDIQIPEQTTPSNGPQVEQYLPPTIINTDGKFLTT